MDGSHFVDWSISADTTSSVEKVAEEAGKAFSSRLDDGSRSLGEELLFRDRGLWAVNTALQLITR